MMCLCVHKLNVGYIKKRLDVGYLRDDIVLLIANISTRIIAQEVHPLVRQSVVWMEYAASIVMAHV